jgi:hypothetical protein
MSSFKFREKKDKEKKPSIEINGIYNFYKRKKDMHRQCEIMCKVILHCQPIAIVFSATPSYLTPLS